MNSCHLTACFKEKIVNVPRTEVFLHAFESIVHQDPLKPRSQNNPPSLKWFLSDITATAKVAQTVAYSARDHVSCFQIVCWRKGHLFIPATQPRNNHSENQIICNTVWQIAHCLSIQPFPTTLPQNCSWSPGGVRIFKLEKNWGRGWDSTYEVMGKPLSLLGEGFSSMACQEEKHQHPSK